MSRARKSKARQEEGRVADLSEADRDAVEAGNGFSSTSADLFIAMYRKSSFTVPLKYIDVVTHVVIRATVRNDLIRFRLGFCSSGSPSVLPTLNAQWSNFSLTAGHLHARLPLERTSEDISLEENWEEVNTW